MIMYVTLFVMPHMTTDMPRLSYSQSCPFLNNDFIEFITRVKKTTGATCETGTAYPFRSIWVHNFVAQSLVFYVVLCLPLFELCPFSSGNCIICLSSNYGFNLFILTKLPILSGCKIIVLSESIINIPTETFLSMHVLLICMSVFKF